MARRKGGHEHPGNGGQAVAEEGDGHKQDDQRRVIGVVGAENKQRQRHAGLHAQHLHMAGRTGGQIDRLAAGEGNGAVEAGHG